MHLTWLDSNSWLIEIADKRILLDPWLVGDLVFGNLTWLFKGSRPQPRPIPENIDLIILSQGLEDHAHLPTLKQLDKNIPVVASRNAAKVVKELGYNQIIALTHGETFTYNQTVEIKAVPGSLVGVNLVENGYILKEREGGLTIYYEPHGSHDPKLKYAAPIDVVITPIVDLALPLVGPIIKGMSNALELAKWVQPQVMIPTAAGGDVVFEGLLNSLLRAKGSIEEFREQLQANGLETRAIAPKPGDRMEIKLDRVRSKDFSPSGA
ncbi:MAG: MBL fold metallo-hydrolase [Hormoscilla sp. GUM202]|nr:MBL fold metallo-hydrolase [Hormoscilla sp. GUM202]